MENLNKEHMEQSHNYIVEMAYYENLLNKEEVTVDDYIEIERNFADRHKMKQSVFRMGKDHAIMVRNRKIEL